MSGSNSRYQWTVDATLRDGLDLYYNDTLEMQFIWLSSAQGSVPQPVIYIGQGFNSTHRIVQWNQVGPKPDPSKKDDGDFPLAIVLGAGGGGIVALAVIIYCCCRHRGTSSTTTGDEETGHTTDHHTGAYQQVNAQPVGQGRGHYTS
jgi:hypothetical protein